MKTAWEYILKVIGIITTCILSLLIVIGLLFNQNNMIKTIEKSGYTKELYTSIEQEMENFAYSANLTSSTLDGVISEEQLKKDLTLFIKDFYTESPSIEDTISSSLKTNIQNYLKEEHIKSIDNEIIDEFVENIKEIYTNNINLNGYVNFIKNDTRKCAKIYPYILIGFTILEIIIIFLLIKFHKGLSQVMFTSSILTIFVVILLVLRLDVSSIRLFSSAFNSFLKFIFTRFITYLLIIGIVEFIAGITYKIITQKKQIN